ncbi:MAG: alpha/beta fold hydrolase [Proteobacteria bacterium]|nr:alpha/beta fold hydrolase [Pseudomonadota bacterium]MBU1058986.1 alpha/beta fold hydrolase [Pseudomonadota bacterium]
METTAIPKVQTIKFLHKVAIIVPSYLLIFAIVAYIALDIEFLQNLYIRHIILALLLLYATSHLIRALTFFFGRWVVAHTSRNFSPERQFNRYRECQQISHCSGEKRQHIVLLLHGFTTSPMDWKILAARLSAEKIDFHAPLISGFGQVNQDSILSIHKEDWFRQIVDTYDLFAERYEKISVIGHSMGGMLACYLAQLRPVHELIISAPALFPQKQQGFYARVVRNRFATNLVSWQIPMIPKPSRSGRSGPADTMDSKATYHYFQYLVAPVRLLFAMLQAQMEIKLDEMSYQRFTLLYGAHDITVDNPVIEKFISSINLPFQRFRFTNSAHNIFVDFDHEQANDLVITLLTDTFSKQDQQKYDYRHYPPAASKGASKCQQKQ